MHIILLWMKGADHWYHAKGEFFENYGTVGVIFGFLLFGSKMYFFFLSEFFFFLKPLIKIITNLN
ncbi:hypothetical protein SU67_23940 [Escherichia coli O139:H28 str. E24377A]|nr:hypothetical protein SU67_23940 [Escherichia coli O139:H28 str. E24377A]